MARATRCKSTYPGLATLNGRPVRCDGAEGHTGQHGHSFAARYWGEHECVPGGCPDPIHGSDRTGCCGVPFADPCRSWCDNA